MSRRTNRRRSGAIRSVARPPNRLIIIRRSWPAADWVMRVARAPRRCRACRAHPRSSLRPTRIPSLASRSIAASRTRNALPIWRVSLLKTLSAICAVFIAASAVWRRLPSIWHCGTKSTPPPPPPPPLHRRHRRHRRHPRHPRHRRHYRHHYRHHRLRVDRHRRRLVSRAIHIRAVDSTDFRISSWLYRARQTLEGQISDGNENDRV